TQSEYSTDILFKSPGHLEELFPRLLSHSTLWFGAKQVMSFLGRKLYSHFQGDVVSDLMDFAFKRLPGIRLKHRVKQNWLKMYNKPVRFSAWRWSSTTRRNSKSEKRSGVMARPSWSGWRCARVSPICFVIGRSRWPPTADT